MIVLKTILPPNSVARGVARVTPIPNFPTIVPNEPGERSRVRTRTFVIPETNPVADAASLTPFLRLFVEAAISRNQRNITRYLLKLRKIQKKSGASDRRNSLILQRFCC
jgi:hypothetical protein